MEEKVECVYCKGLNTVYKHNDYEHNWDDNDQVDTWDVYRCNDCELDFNTNHSNHRDDESEYF